MSAIMQLEENFMTRVESYSMEDLMVLARSANLPCVQGINGDFVTEKVLRKALILKYQNDIFITHLTRLSREVAAYLSKFLGEFSTFRIPCDMAIVIDNIAWIMFSKTKNEKVVQRWAVKKILEPTNHMHPDMRGKAVVRDFSIDVYDEYYELPNYGTVHEALLGIGYAPEAPLDFSLNMPCSMWDEWNDLEDEEFLSFPPEFGPTFMVWLDQPDALPEWHDRLIA